MATATELLPFQRALLEQVLEGDCLCVLAPGLGLHQTVSVLLRLQDVRLQVAEESGTVIIIGASPFQRTALRQELARIHPAADRARRPDAPTPPPLLPADVTADIPTAERLRLYRTCSCLFVTTRILVVDLLSGRLLPSDVAGLCILNGHRITDSSGEGFAVRLYRGGNSSGFVRAFSDVPAAFAAEFGKAEKVLKVLNARRLLLWPRFQMEVQTDLEARPPELVEISLPCDPGAQLVYEALAELVDGCIKELRKHERLDTADLTPSQGLSSAFDESIRRQLAPIWHTVSPRTRQIVADLRTLRTLAIFLNKLDPVTFITYLDTLRVTEGTRCAWIFHSAAHIVFEAAKARVYRLAAPTAATRKRKAEYSGTGGAAATTSGDAGGVVPTIEPVLDELPKWHALLEVLEEARQEQKAAGETTEPPAAENEAPAAEASTSAKPSAQQPPILVFCQDEVTCAQLREVCGGEGPSGLMRRVYREYLQYKIDSGGGAKRKPGDGAVPATASSGPRMMGGYVQGEEAALAKEARGVGASRSKGRGGAAGGRGRGGGRGGGTVTAAAALKMASEALAGASTKDSKQKDAAADAAANPADVVLVALDAQGALPLWEHSPTHVIVYDPDVALTRSLELFKAQRRSVPLRVYLLRYEASPEMDRFQNAVLRERSAFEGLIRAKGIMAPPTTTAAVAGGGSGSAAIAGGSNGLPPMLPSPQGANNAQTRRAGGRLGQRPEPVKVIVDVREFMSPLPAVLHSRGLEVVPLTLEVGDYVLSPEICVERKSLPDLRQSLTSGRLYQQAEAMAKHYKTSILLVEFDGDREFALQGAGELGDDVQAHSLMSRLVLLCLHHPRLRLVWSRSLHATADIFRQLKSNHEEPDPVTAATVGVGSGEEGGGAGEVLVNSGAIELLRCLPGVTEANYRGLMREAGSLAGLARVDLPRLATVMGGEVHAKKLHEFLQQECRALFKAL